MVIAFEVRGLPVTQGNKTAFPSRDGTRAFMREGRSNKANEGFHAWRHAIATEARHAAGDRPLLTGQPLQVVLHFRILKPASAPKTRRTWPIKARSGDIDKLARAALDAMTGVVFADDSEVVVLAVMKDWGDPGVTVEVDIVDDSDHARSIVDDEEHVPR